MVTSWRRIEEAEKSNQETKKYEREHHICLVYAKNGHGMVSDEEFYGASYGLNLDNDFGLRNGGTGGSLIMPALPGHGESGNQNAPLGGGALLLIGFGAAYALKKRKSRK